MLESEIKRLELLGQSSSHEAGELSKKLANMTKLLAEAEAKIVKIKGELINTEASVK